jgi:hypothetical protein
MKYSFARPLAAILIYSVILPILPLRVEAADKASYSANEINMETHGSEFIMRRYPGEKLVPVRILSGVKSPGTYYLPVGTDFLTLLSLSGGILPSSDTENILLNKWESKTVQEINLEKSLQHPAKYNPILSNNDVLYIPEKSPIVDNNTLVVVGLIGSIIGIIVGGIVITKGLK